jgi:hypothetical protein
VQRLTAAKVYDQRKDLVDQKMTDCLEADTAARIAADYLVSDGVNDEVGEIGKGKCVATWGLTATKPSPATGKP